MGWGVGGWRGTEDARAPGSTPVPRGSPPPPGLHPLGAEPPRAPPTERSQNSGPTAQLGLLEVRFLATSQILSNFQKEQPGNPQRLSVLCRVLEFQPRRDLGRLQVALAKASSLPETAWKACLLTGLNGWFSFPDFSRKDWQSCVCPGVRASAPRPGCWSVCPCPRPRSDAFAGRGGPPLLGCSLHVC